MQTVSDALALGLFSGSSKLIVIAAAVVVVLAIVVVFFMVLRSDNGESKTSRGLAFDPDEGPAGAFGGPGARQNAPGSDWNGAAQRGFGNEAMHRPGDFGGTVGSTGSGTPSRPQQPAGWGTPGGAPAWGQADQQPGWGQQNDSAPAWGQAARQAAQPVGQGQQQPGGWGQPMQGPPSRPQQPMQDAGWGEQAQAGWGQPQGRPAAAPGWDATPQQQPAWNAPQGPQNNAWGSPAAAPQQGQNGWGAPQQAPGGWNGQGQQQQQQPGGWGAPQNDNAAGWGAPAGQPNAPAAGAGPRSEARIAYIIIREGKEPGRTFEMRKDRMSIGRSRESDIFLEDLAVSRLHASIYRDDQGSYILRDENSANGTTVNGQRVNEHRLNEGDEIQVGQTTMTFTRR